MVKKNTTKRVWQNKQKPQSRQNRIPQIQQLSKSQDSEFQQSSSEQKSNQNEKQIQLNKNSSPHANYNLSLKKPSEYVQITDQLLKLMRQRIYKDIVMNQFIQTNQNLNEIQRQRPSTDQFHQQYQAKKQQRSQIVDFIEDQPLDFPEYLKPFRNPFALNQSIKSINKIYAEQQSSRRSFLLNLKSILLQPSHIKYLNIYGPTGSGKTHCLKSIICEKNLYDKIIWINGMNIINGKTKKFLSNLSSSFNNLVNQIYKNESQNLTWTRQNFLKQVLDRKNDKILVLDQFDQMNHFQIVDILKYCYVENYQSGDSGQFFCISKIILISNSFKALQDMTIQKFRSFNAKAISQKSLYIQNIVFRPFVQNDVEEIIRFKIQRVNDRFQNNMKADGTKQIFSSIFANNTVGGIFTELRIRNVIKKVCFSQDIDIRKVFEFYTNAFQKLIEKLTQTKQKIEQQRKLMDQSFNQARITDKHRTKKFQQYLVDEKFILSLLYENGLQISKDNQNDDDPLLYYVNTLQTQGKLILRGITSALMLKRRLSRRGPVEQSKRKSSNKNPAEFKGPQTQSKLSTESKRARTIKLMDFYRFIKHNVKFLKIYPWLKEWQEMGLIKLMRQQLKSQIKNTGSYCSFSTQSIKIIDNLKLCVIQEEVIRKGLGIY